MCEIFNVFACMCVFFNVSLSLLLSSLMCVCVFLDL